MLTRPSLEESLRSFGNDVFGECRSDTERCACGRRGCRCCEAPACTGGSNTIPGARALAIWTVQLGMTFYVMPISRRRI